MARPTHNVLAPERPGENIISVQDHARNSVSKSTRVAHSVLLGHVPAEIDH